MKTNSEMQQDLRDLILCSKVLRQAQKNYFADRSPNNLQDAKKIERDFDILNSTLDKKYNGIQQSLDLAPVPDELEFGSGENDWKLFPLNQNIIKARKINPADGPERIEVLFKSGSTYHYFQTGSNSLDTDWRRWMEQPPAALMDYFIRNIRTKLKYIKAEGE
jgi:hypothetical protein